MGFRFTMRRMMAVTALAALAIVATQRAVDVSTRRAAVMRQRSSDHQFQARIHDVFGKGHAALAKAMPDGDERRRALNLAEWHKQRGQISKQKSRLAARAATRPWLRMEENALPPPYYPSAAPTAPLVAKEHQPENPTPPAAPVDDGYGLEWPIRWRESQTPDPKGERSDAGGLPGPKPGRFSNHRPAWAV